LPRRKAVKDLKKKGGSGKKQIGNKKRKKNMGSKRVETAETILSKEVRKTAEVYRKPQGGGSARTMPGQEIGKEVYDTEQNDKGENEKLERPKTE